MIQELLELNMDHHQQLIKWLQVCIQVQAVSQGQDQDWLHLNILPHQESNTEPQEQQDSHLTVQLELLELLEHTEQDQE